MSERCIPQVAIDRPPSNEQCAKERFGLPKDWQWFRSALLGAHPHYIGIELTGGVFPVKVTRGKRKGLPNFRKPVPGSLATVALSNEQIDEWTGRWELETGLCADCQGSTLEWRGWSRETGTRYDPCRKCKATGRIIKQSEAA